jgi:MFS family permease
VWGAVLAVSLQERATELGGTSDAALRGYTIAVVLGAAVATLVQFVFGLASDRRRKVVGHRLEFYLAGLIVAVPSLVWFYLAPTWTQFVIAFAGLQLGMNAVIASFQAAIPDFVPHERRGTASSWLSAYQSIGNALGLLVAGFVHDMRAAAAALAIPFVAAWSITFAYIRSRKAIDEEPAAVIPFGRALVVLLFSRGFVNIGFFTLVDFLAFFVRESLGFAGDAMQTQTALLFLTFTVCAIPGAIVAARPADRGDKRLVVTVACSAIAVALAMLAGAHLLVGAYAAAAFAGIGWGAFVTADYALAAAILPPASMATGMGIWNFATTLPQVIAPIAVLPIILSYDRVAPGLGPRAAILIALAEFLIGAALIWRLPRA